MDVLAEWKVQGRVLRAGLVTTEDELDEQARVRHDMYAVRNGEIAPRPDGKDVDEFDSHSIFLCSKLDDDPRVRGVMRLIRLVNGCILTHGENGGPVSFSGVPYSLPTVNPVTGQPVLLSETCEGSRWVAPVIPLDSGDMIAHSNILLEAGLEAARLMGMRHIVGALREFHWHHCIADGWEFHEVMGRSDGKPHLYHGSPYRAVIIPVFDDPTRNRVSRRIVPRRSGGSPVADEISPGGPA